VNMSSSLFLEDSTRSTVNVHPVVVFSILDHFMRRDEEQERVIGTLLGSIHEGVVNITSCFPVPHAEKSGGEIAIGKDFNKTMLALHQSVNPRQKVVGWYSSSPCDGDDITDSSILIHDFYGHECRSPVHLTIDTSLQSNKLSIKAFSSAPVIMRESAVAAHFTQMSVKMIKDEASTVSIDAMIKGSSLNNDNDQEVKELTGDLDNLLSSMLKLHEYLNMSCEYVDNVIAGKVEPDHAVGRLLSDAVSSIPKLDKEVFKKMLGSSVADLNMVIYLSSLGKTQLEIAEKLNIY
jgi:translation initiation factor 3 subunit F